MSKFKPMLSGTAPKDLSTLRYPLLASPKLDGIRAVMIGGVAMSRSLKPIPNEYVQRCLAGCPDGLDGELMTEGGYNAVQSAIMSRDGEPEFRFCVFDWHNTAARVMGAAFQDRYEQTRQFLEESQHPWCQLVPHTLVSTPEELLALEQTYLAAGFEGVMVRDPDGPYKYGRSTVKQGWLLKIKQFEDEEALVIGVEEQMHNANELGSDELGRAKRSHAKEGLVPAGVLGALLCRTKDGAEFGIGTGFTADQREELWALSSFPDGVKGRTVKFKHLPPPGGRPAGVPPRHPVFLGFRHEDDQ